MNTNGEVKLEGILPNLLFGDGAGAIIVGPPKPGTWLIDGPTGALLGKDTAGDIDLKVGFTIVSALSTFFYFFKLFLFYYLDDCSRNCIYLSF